MSAVVSLFSRGILSIAVAAVVLSAGTAWPQKVYINDHYPDSGPNGPNLSPPNVVATNECATHVYVDSFVPHATIKVILNGTTVIGTAVPPFGFWAIPLSHQLALGDKITATQTVNGLTSAPSAPAVIGHMPSMLPGPNIDPKIYSCGHVAPVHNLTSGVTVSVRDSTASAVIGTGFTPNDWGSDWDPVGTSALVQAHELTAKQNACNGAVSPDSAPVPVQPEPTPVLPPSLDTPILNNDAVTAHGLYNGALLQIFDHTTQIGAGYATAADNWTSVPTITSAMSISAMQSLCHHSSQTPPVTPTKTIPPPILLSPICPQQSNALVRNTTIDATLVLLKNNAVVGYGGAAPGDVPIDIAPPNQFQTGDHVTVVEYMGPTIGQPSNTVVVNCAKQNVVTQHNNNARQGAQLHETTLTPSNVSGPSFGFLYDRHVLGTLLAQPLYVHGVKTSSGLKNLIFVATAQDVVYAFDADDHSADTTVDVTIQTDVGTTVSVPESTKYVWRTVLGKPHVGDICGETTPPVVGITSTPVIDVSGGKMYVTARNQVTDTGLGNDYLHAIDIETGMDLANVKVGGTDPMHGIVFDPSVQRQRVGLLLQNGTVYLGFGTYSCDNGNYHGWIFGYTAASLKPAGIFTTAQSSNDLGSGVWASGNGLAGTDDGSIFFQTGNDLPANGAPAMLGDSFVKLRGDGSSLTLLAHYQPAAAQNYKAGDTDLGAGGPMLLPGGNLIGGGKDGAFYTLAQSDLTPKQPLFQAFFNTFHVGPTPYPYNTPAVQPTLCPAASPFGVADEDQPCYIPVAQYQMGESFGPNIHTGPVFWQNTAKHGFVYKMPEKDYLKAFDYDLTAGVIGTTPALVATVRPLRDGMPGGFSSISANGMKNGIVWTVVQQANSMFGDQHPALLYANDAITLKQLWNNDEWQTTLAKFAAPTIADGQVVLPSEGLFQVYGLASNKIRQLKDYPLAEAIRIKWLNSGGAYGMLGEPLGGVVKEANGGGHQDFSKLFAGGGYGQVSVPPSVKTAKPVEIGPIREPEVQVVSSIYFAPNIGPHFVIGEIRRLWLNLGGVSKLGYPLTDEVPTPDGFGLMTRFEHGTITWHRGQNAKLETTLPK